MTIAPLPARASRRQHLRSGLRVCPWQPILIVNRIHLQGLGKVEGRQRISGRFNLRSGSLSDGIEGRLRGSAWAADTLLQLSYSSIYPLP
jgi:hypothetical protein